MKNIILSIFFLCMYYLIEAQTINTVAGNGISGFSGDGGLATNAQIYATRVTADNSNNFYFSDRSNYRIRKIMNNGIITTIAGDGTIGFSGDGGLATNAQLNSPWGVAVDKNGVIFIADTKNHRIRKISNNGIITTIAGNGIQGFSGDGGLATNAQLKSPYGVAVDKNGVIFIADTHNDRIRKVTTNGVITTVAGNGNRGFSGDGGQATNAQLNQPSDVAVDLNGNIYICEWGNHTIRKVATNGVITTIAGNGIAGFSGDGNIATNAQLNQPDGVAVNSNGVVFIADAKNHRIRKVVSNGVITTIAGNGIAGYSGDGNIATNAQLNWPYGVAVDNSNIYIADQFNYRVRKINLNNTVPIQFNSIKAFEYSTAVKIEWSVSNEVNVNKYEVEASIDGNNFYKVNSITANNNITYNCLHTNPNIGNNYYRIKSIQNDGKVQYSQIVNVKIGKAKNSFNVFPNPIQNNTIQLQLEGVDKGIYNVVLYNQAGQQIFKNTINHAGGSASESLNTGKISKGIYQLIIEGLNVKTSTKTIVVE